MKTGRMVIIAGIVLICAVGFSGEIVVMAQGKGKGAGKPAGNPGKGGRPDNTPGVDKGLDKASRKSKGRSDDGLETASRKSKGRSDDGLERARAGDHNRRRADREFRDYPEIGKHFGKDTNELKRRYESALGVNPDLKFGHFVAAHNLERNLGRRHPGISADAILDGLADGRSLGQTLQSLGLSSRDARDAEREADRQWKEMKRR